AASVGVVLKQNAVHADCHHAEGVADSASAADGAVPCQHSVRHRQRASVVVDAAAGPSGEVGIHRTVADAQAAVVVVDAAAVLHGVVVASVTVIAVVAHPAVVHD